MEINATQIWSKVFENWETQTKHPKIIRMKVNEKEEEQDDEEED